MSLKSKVESLIAAGNATTGQSKADLTSVVQDLVDGYGQGGVTIESLSVTQNGTYTAPSGKAYSPISVSVPNSYSASDEGKVVNNGALISQTSDTVTENGTVDTTLIDSLTVNVSGVSGEFPYDEYVLGETPFGLFWLDSVTILQGGNIFKNLTGIHCGNSVTNLTSMFAKSIVKTLVFEHRASFASTYSLLQDCTALQFFDIDTTSTASNNFYRNCDSLATIIYRRSDGISALGNGASSVFYNTNGGGTPPFLSAGTGGTLIVPKLKIESYKSASNWSGTLNYTNNMILPIEGTYYETHYADGVVIEGKSYSDPKYCLMSWIAYDNDGKVVINKNTHRGVLVQLRGEHPFQRLNETNTHTYPVEIPSETTGFTVESGSLDVEINEAKWDTDKWVKNTGTGWLLQADANSHSYEFTDQTTTHIFINFRVAGDTEDAETVTQAMMDAITFEWNS